MAVAVEDEAGGEADDAAGTELEQVALTGGELLGGDQGSQRREATSPTRPTGRPRR
jgi:hypothetical protein